MLSTSILFLLSLAVSQLSSHPENPVNLEIFQGFNFPWDATAATGSTNAPHLNLWLRAFS